MGATCVWRLRLYPLMWSVAAILRETPSNLDVKSEFVIVDIRSLAHVKPHDKNPSQGALMFADHDTNCHW